MRKPLHLLAAGLILALAGTPADAQGPADAADRFERVLRPMLKEKCLGCHGEGEELEANLDLTTRQAMLKGGDGGPALEPGDP